MIVCRNDAHLNEWRRPFVFDVIELLVVIVVEFSERLIGQIRL